MEKLFNAKFWGNDENGYWEIDLNNVSEKTIKQKLLQFDSTYEDYVVWESDVWESSETPEDEMVFDNTCSSHDAVNCGRCGNSM